MVITIAGGGSTFTAGIVKSIALRREELEVDEIRLFDINKERQDKVAVVVDWVLHKELNTDIKLVVTTDVQQAYTDASFVFAQMRVGEVAQLVCPPALAYGAQGVPGVIPPNSTLVFEIQLLDIVRR